MAGRDFTASCAICGGPGDPECPCEGTRLKIAVEQAEKRWIETWVGKTREWVTSLSVQYITRTFEQLREVRRRDHAAYILTIPHYHVYAHYRGRPPLHPHVLAQLNRQLADADADLKRGIDADWKACVLRYPEVLAHFYSFVNIGIPPEPAPPELKGLTSGPAPAASPPQAFGFPGIGSAAGLGVLAGAMPPPGAPLSRAPSQSKKSSVASKRGSMSRAAKDLDREMERHLFEDLYPRGAKKTNVTAPPPPPEQPRRPTPSAAASATRRRDGLQYTQIAGRAPMPGPQPPPGVPMPPGYGSYARY